MGFRAAVQWWEVWQLRVLVLTSLFLQCFLSLAAILRKSCIPSWLRFLVWLAYLSSDAVAIYGLATLFNRQRTQEWVSTHQSSARLQVLWAPILLIHLGGQDSITAYNIEDNELWRRHVLTAVSQVAVAVYVFRNSWPEETAILAVGLMLLSVGILKCVLKPWDLKRVSINNLVDSSTGSEENPDVSSLEEYIRAATENFQEGNGGQQYGSNQGDDEDKMWKPYDLFVDLSPPYSDRLSCLKAMVHNTPGKVHGLLRYGLCMTFERLYTKESLQLKPNATNNHTSSLRFTVNTAALAYVLRAFALSHREAYDHTDVNITIILVFLAYGLEYLIPHTISFTDKIIGTNDKGRWPDQVAQYNLMGYLVRNKKHRKLRSLATLLVCKSYMDQHWCMKPSKSSREITKLVHGYIAEAWTEHHIKDMATFRAFNDNRGQWTLKREGCGDNLDWSLERPFDESVLLWHLATDFCFHLTGTSPRDETAKRCRVMSNYMVYLLFVNPEMLMTGARRFLFREAYKQLKKMLKLMPQLDDGAGPMRDESELAQKIAQNIRHASAAVDSCGQRFTYIDNAWRLAQHLKSLSMDHQDDAKMWNVIQGVWVEMICFSAGRCRGYLHAKSLGKGGEYLSYIWLLMSYMGMETLAERMQRTKMKEDEARNNGDTSGGTTTAASPSSLATGRGTTEASTSTLVTEGGDVDGMVSASPVTTTDPHGSIRTAASTTTPSGDENV